MMALAVVFAALASPLATAVEALKKHYETDYVSILKSSRIDASFIEVPAAGHDELVKTREYMNAIYDLRRERS